MKQLEVEVLQVGNLLRTMEISEDKASQRDGETTAKITAISAQLEEVSAKAEKFEEKSSGLDHQIDELEGKTCLLYTSPSPRDKRQSRMPSSA